MKKIIIISFISVTILALWLGFYVYKWEYRKPLFEVHFLSLKRGRAIFIRTPENKTMLIGAGQNSEVIREITKVMPFYSRKIDYVFVPSATAEQIGGILEIIDRYEVEEIIKPKIMATSTVLTKLLDKISNKKIHVREVERGDRLDLRGLRMDVLFPVPNFKYNKTSLPELALAFVYKKSGLYLFGKLSKTIQKNVLKNMDVLTTDNLVEFYNSDGKNKNFDDLVSEIKPKYVFTTKEKTSNWVTGGEDWTQDE